MTTDSTSQPEVPDARQPHWQTTTQTPHSHTVTSLDLIIHTHETLDPA